MKDSISVILSAVLTLFWFSTISSSSNILHHQDYSVYMSELNGQILKGNAFRVEAVRRILYDNGMNHILTIECDNRFEMMHVTFHRFIVEDSGVASECLDWLRLHDGDSVSAPLLHSDHVKLCGRRRNLSSLNFNTSSRHLTFHFTTDFTAVFEGFEAMVTAFRLQCNVDTDFACASGDMCIDAGLRCNGVVHCPDGSDELPDNCLTKSEVKVAMQTTSFIYSGSLVLIFVVAATICLAIFFYRRRKERQFLEESRDIKTYPITENYRENRFYGRFRSEVPTDKN